jgi:hypothetical protein
LHQSKVLHVIGPALLCWQALLGGPTRKDSEVCCAWTVLLQAVTGCHSASGSALPPTLTFRAATQQLVAYLLTLHQPHTRTGPAAAPPHHTEDCEQDDQPHGRSNGPCSSSGVQSGLGSSARPGPESIDDFLWWCEDRSSRRHGSSSSCAMLDCAVAVLHDLLGLSAHEEQLLHGTQWAEGAVMEVLREVSCCCCCCS